ncbi:MAG: hypothetical protein DI558_12880 [Corynebacterium propinquum]|nr:MAG: hypothetical protein DI558_12880 [Corynebacterium propinquum]
MIAGQELAFGPDYLIPKPFDARLILRIAPAVAQAAAKDGVATLKLGQARGVAMLAQRLAACSISTAVRMPTAARSIRARD